MPAIEVEDLFKSYGPVDAVRGISFRVEEGEVFALLGPNGAGKTTLIGILTTRVRITAGEALVSGVNVTTDPSGVRRRIGVVPQRPNPDRSLEDIRPRIQAGSCSTECRTACRRKQDPFRTSAARRV